MAGVPSGAREMSFMPRSVIGSGGALRSYGKRGARVQTIARLSAAAGACVLVGLFASMRRGLAAEARVKIVALGDSLTAGFGLPREDAFPARLEAALKAKGLAVEIANAGVSGDTASGGLARLDWSVPAGTDAVILELVAKDMLLAGMRAAPTLGAGYGREFEAIYSELAAANDLLLYPFFLDGVAAESKLN